MHLSDCNSCYLGDVKLRVAGGFHLELLVPFAFEVDGVDQHQPGIAVHETLDQKILDFPWRTQRSQFRSGATFYICSETKSRNPPSVCFSTQLLMWMRVASAAL